MRWNGPLNKVDAFRYEIPSSYTGEHQNLKMKTSAVIYTSEQMLPKLRDDNAPEQAANVTMLPGIVGKSLAMPDIHWGYGFPIGGVAATDADEGVISPGGVGFDINCLSGDAMILHEHGYTKKIKDFERNWRSEHIQCANYGKKIINTPINAFMRFPTKKSICEVSTESGKRLVSTEDHPFYTPAGMIPLKDLAVGDRVAVNPFEGVEFYEPSDTLIVTEEDISRCPFKKQITQVIAELKKRGLLPLRMNNEKLPYLLKLIGYILGDGTMYFTKEKGTIWLYGEPKDLEMIQADITKLGFTASKIYKRERSHKIETTYDTVRFQRTEYSVKTTASSLAVLFWAMGVPVGNKCAQEYLLPQWVFGLELWQKRLLLASFFGAELSSPSTVTHHGYNFYCPILSMNKHEKLVGNGRRFLTQIRDLLACFDVKASLIRERKEYVNKEGNVSFRLRLEISASPGNLLFLWSRVGFVYNKKRSCLANLAVHYLHVKQTVLRERREAEITAKKLKKKGFTRVEIYERLKSSYVNFRFIERSLYEDRKTSPRIASGFPHFHAFIDAYTQGLGDSGLVWDTLKVKTTAGSEPFVYDFTVADYHHNFIASQFVVSNCGVRLVRTNLHSSDLNMKKIQELIDQMFVNVPAGLGSKAKVRLSKKQLDDVLLLGAKWAVENGYGWDKDIEFLEENGCLQGAQVLKISEKAKQRGAPQLGSLGAGNHFLEIQKVAEIYDPVAAKIYGVTGIDQIMVMIHTGSRGFGHQVCTDHLQVLEQAVRKYNIQLPDRQLACAPVKSKEGQEYLNAMACAANFAWCNRQMIVHWVRESFEHVLQQKAEDLRMEIIYDVCHNIAKLEEHEVDGKKQKVYVHRKGATRAFGPGKTEVPLKYRDVGQPVLIPGDMGTESYLLRGTKEAEETFGSTCHGAGRVMSRHQAVQNWRGEAIMKMLKQKGIYAHPASWKVMAEEAPDAYKDVSQVVDVTHGARLSLKVARLVPLGVVKG
ncbi:MAG: intein-containing RctB family protein [Methanobacteriota archaeon]